MQDQMENSASSQAPIIAFVHFDLHGEHFNGVAVEEVKYEKVFRNLGWQIRTVAGEGDVSHLIPGMDIDPGPDAPPIEYGLLLSAFKGVDVVWVLNLCSLPFNRRAADLVVQAVTELDVPTIFNHHDLPWEHDFDYDIPVDKDRPWHNVTTSNFLLESLMEKGLTAHVIGTGWDVSPPPLSRQSIRSTLGLQAQHRLFTQTTRLSSGKDVLGALQCTLDIHRQDPSHPLAYWITGPPGIHAKGKYVDDFFDLAAQCEKEGMIVRWGDCGLGSCNPAKAAYAVSDLIFFPPNEGEGFGMPPLEAALYMCPVAVGRDPRVEATRADVGLTYLPVDPTTIMEWFAQPKGVRHTELQLNRFRAANRFSFDKFTQRIRNLLHECDLGHLLEQGEACVGAAARVKDADEAAPTKSPLSLDLLAPTCIRNFEHGKYGSNRGDAGQSNGMQMQGDPFLLPLLSPLSPIPALG